MKNHLIGLLFAAILAVGLVACTSGSEQNGGGITTGRQQQPGTAPSPMATPGSVSGS
jgi:hypothetical protein